MDITQFAILTTFKPAVWWHSVHSRCCASSTAICFENVFITPTWQASNLKHRIHTPWGLLAAQAFWRTLGGSPRVPVKIPKEYKERERWFRSSYVCLVSVSFGRHFISALSLQLPPWLHPSHPVGRLGISFSVLKHL